MGLATLMRRSYVNGGLGIKVETGDRVPGDTDDVVDVFDITGECAITFLTAQVVTVTKDAGATIRVYHYNDQTTAETFFSLAGDIQVRPAGMLLQFPDVITDLNLFVDAITPVTAAADPFLFGVLNGFGISILVSDGHIRYVIETAPSTEGLLKWYLYYIPISWNAEITPSF